MFGFSFITEEGLGRNLEVVTEAGALKKNAVSGLLGHLFYITQVHLLRDDITQSQLGCPSSISN